ncbi:MAG: hypothetical protein ACRDV3_04285 [Acidothermaceae bacterium]
MFRTALRLRWLPRHVLLVVLVTTLSLLGRWQWDVSESQRGGLQNLLYAFQWWFMAAMVIYGWARLLHDAAHPKAATTSTVSSSVAPAGLVADGESWTPRLSTSDLIDAQLATADTESAAGESDDELVAYNEYLARLNQRAQRAH